MAARNSVLAKLADAKPYVHPEAFLTIQEAAAVSGLAVGTIQRWVMRRRIRSFGYRGAIRVRLCDVLPEFEAVQIEDRRMRSANPRGEFESEAHFKKAAAPEAKPRETGEAGKKGRR